MKYDPAPASLPSQAIEAIANGLHGDPFAVLGPHQVARPIRLPSRRSARLQQLPLSMAGQDTTGTTACGWRNAG
jgi:hypothetical protein